jgi:hypothetical protein
LVLVHCECDRTCDFRQLHELYNLCKNYEADCISRVRCRGTLGHVTAQDKYRWGRCSAPLSAAAMKEEGTPLLASHLREVVSDLSWGDLQVCAAF